MMTNVSLPTISIMIAINLGSILVFIKYTRILFGEHKTGVAIEKPDGCQRVSTFALGVLCFALGILGTTVIDLLFGVPLDVSVAGYIEKILFFSGSLFVGYWIFRLFIKSHAPWLEKIRKIDLSFRAMCVSMGVFFAMILISLSIL